MADYFDFTSNDLDFNSAASILRHIGYSYGKESGSKFLAKLVSTYGADFSILEEVAEGFEYFDGHTYEVPTRELEYVQERVDKLAKKASSHGLLPPTVEVLYRYLRVENHLPDAEPLYYDTLVLGVVVPSFKIEGWELAGVVDILDGGGVVTWMEGFKDFAKKVPEKWYSRDQCDHCKKMRRRKQTLLVYNEETKKLRRVGKSCGKDFFGNGVANILAAANIPRRLRKLFRLDAWDWMRSYSVRGCLARGLESVSRDGYRSRKQEREGGGPSTATLVLESLRPLPSLDSDEAVGMVRVAFPAPQFYEQADVILEHFRNLPDSENDYEMNVRAVARSEAIDYKHMGYLVSMIPTYERDTAPEEKALPAVKYFGQVGERLGREYPARRVTCVYTRRIEGNYGTTQLCKYRDDEGHTFVWFNSGSSVRNEVGDVGFLSGTIKRHSTYNDEKQTQLNRCKWKAISSGIQICDNEIRFTYYDEVHVAKCIFEDGYFRLRVHRGFHWGYFKEECQNLGWDLPDFDRYSNDPGDRTSTYSWDLGKVSILLSESSVTANVRTQMGCCQKGYVVFQWDTTPGAGKFIAHKGGSDVVTSLQKLGFPRPDRENTETAEWKVNYPCHHRYEESTCLRCGQAG